ncbi:helix-turn-helix domain-containing protein [Streptomyces albireticuli]|uniref:helix-turn-helix domain-containing protein n=1 Tax=Streptomyces albireticuli TaxID=1940 RepID=UPI0036CA520D
MSEPRPSVRRRRLAALLVRLREDAGKTPEEAAERIGCHRSKISRIENARLGLSLGELRDLLTFYGVDDPSYVDEVSNLARRGTDRGWVQRLGVALPSYADYIDYEQTANYVRSYQPMLIAGLLQTAEYARELFRASPVRMPPHRVDELVTVRMQRQKVLTGESAPQVCVIEGEGALRGHVGGAKVMRAQLEHLQAMGELVELQVLPLGAGAHAGVMGSFVLFSFPTPAFSDVVCVEHRTGTLYMETPEETDVYTLTFDSLRSAALSPSASLDLITRIKQEL